MSLRLALALALSGLPLGAMYALQAMGIVLVYKTSGVFNFAQGAIGMAAAYVASGLGVSLGLPAWLAVLGAVLFGGMLGVVIERVTIRPAKGALPRTIITLGWLLALQGLVGLVFGTELGRRPVSLFSPDTAVRIDALATAFGWDQLGVLVTAVVVAGGLGLFFRRSPLGVAMRAVSEGADAARLLGIRVRVVTLAAWALGAGLAALAGVLVTPLLGTLDTVGLVVFTIQALAAALVGGLTSLPLTFAGGILLGMGQPVIGRLLGSPAGVNELIALAVVLGALLLRRRTGRGDSGSDGLEPSPLRALPKGRVAAIAAGGLTAALVLPVLLGGPQANFQLAGLLAWALAVLSLVLLAGVVGQVSLCQAFFMAVGAYGAGIFMSHGLSFLAAMPLGALLAAAVAAVVGIPALRLRGLELAIATLSLAFAADRYFFRWAPLVGKDSVRPLPRPAFADEVLHGVAGARAYTLLVAAVLVLCAWWVASLRRGRTGAALTALRSSTAATAAMGFSVTSLKLRGFAASGFVAGLAGVLFSGLSHIAGYAPFDFTRSISLLAYAVIAGIGSVPGAVVGGAIVTLSALSVGGGSGEIPSGDAASVVTILTGAALIAVVVGAPTGLAGLLTRLRERFTPAAHGPPPPPAHDDTTEIVVVTASREAKR
jgi:ABC-type branched-subunit amino acid transport system permease subunit